MKNTLISINMNILLVFLVSLVSLIACAAPSNKNENTIEKKSSVRERRVSIKDKNEVLNEISDSTKSLSQNLKIKPRGGGRISHTSTTKQGRDSNFEIGSKSTNQKKSNSKSVNQISNKNQNLKEGILDTYLLALLKKYSNAKSISFDLEKKVHLTLLEKTKTYKGKATLKPPGRFRFELDGEGKSLVVINKDQAWFVKFPEDPDLGEKIQVTTTKNPFKGSKAESIQSILFQSIISGKKVFESNFKVSNRTENKEWFIYNLKPLVKSDSIKDLTVRISKKENLISNMKYLDQLDNEIEFVLAKTKFNMKLKDSIFNFNPPKDADVIELN